MSPVRWTPLRMEWAKPAPWQVNPRGAGGREIRAKKGPRNLTLPGNTWSGPRTVAHRDKELAKPLASEPACRWALQEEQAAHRTAAMPEQKTGRHSPLVVRAAEAESEDLEAKKTKTGQTITTAQVARSQQTAGTTVGPLRALDQNDALP